MRNSNRNETGPAAVRSLMVLFGFAMLAVGACGGAPGDKNGEVINVIVLPTDTLLNLACAEVGINNEPCVLGDPENPFITTATREFNVNDPGAETKFALAAQIPVGPTGAKARFYLWATALARFPSGENQYMTALALHELFNANSDALIQEQALKAFRSVLDNFFGSAIFFECCANLDPNGDPVPFPIPLNELTADALYRTAATGYVRLIPGDPLLAISRLGDWGYTYQPANPPNYDDGVVSVIDF